MHRISCRFTAAYGVAALLGVGLLAGCSQHGSTASSTPSPPGAENDTPGARPDSNAAAPPGPAQALPGGPARSGLGPKETAYLNALKAAGIAPGDPDAEISVAHMICFSIQNKQPPDQLRVFVNAVAGSDAKAAGKPIADSDIDQLGRVYIDTARTTYC